ncbi:gluconokinase [Actinocrinis sp.]|uniref:gluconokinase n=1 Tax=Actinocrinis sp. TaxID=1920516 RepID=UPI002D252E3C|nr:gluconokinase [Actinocrinis sp.]HZP54275.1 gluconokinase [Actinocrinis sp.]
MPPPTPPTSESPISEPPTSEPQPAPGREEGGGDADGPPVLLITGVSGSGKTTIGSLLAGRLGWTYAEADAFHPEHNIAKMAAGHPLDDADREPWLEAIGAWIDETTRAGRPAVVTCSALKRAYRDKLRKGRPNVRLIYLDADRRIVGGRLATRSGHFFPAQLLASQFRDLQRPDPEEHAVLVDVTATPEDIVERLIEGLTA